MTNLLFSIQNNNFWFNEEGTKLYFVGYELYSNSSKFYSIDLQNQPTEGKKNNQDPQFDIFK